MSMTIEQAKSELMQIYGALSPNKQRAIDTLLHTIEQEPSNVMEHDKDHIWYKGKQYISLNRFLQVRTIEVNMGQAPVNPQEQKTGHWIWGVEHGYNREHPYCKCSECGMGMGHTEYDYCPNCGAKMVEPQESEV